MTFRTLILAAFMAGIFVLPGIAMAEETAPAAPEGTKTPVMQKHFEEADTDKNGTLSLDEFLERHKKKFVEIDADKSGDLTPEEMRAYGEAHREEWKERREKMRDMKAKIDGMKEETDKAPEAPAE